MAHEVETMAYAGATPWHGLGEKVADNLTPEQMVKAAGIDWKVQKAPMVASFASPDGGKPRMINVEGFSSLIRDSDGKVLGICGRDYVPTQNVDAFKFFKRFTNAGHMKMETAGSLRGGKLVWGLASIQAGFKLAGGDEVKGFLLLGHPHEWGKSLQLRFTTVRTVCQNTYNMAIRETGVGNVFRMIHNQEFSETVMDDAENVLGTCTNLLNDFATEAKILADTKVEDKLAKGFVAHLFQPELLEWIEKPILKNPEETAKRILAHDQEVNPMQFKKNASAVYEAIANQPGADLKSSRGTMWGLFNAVTYAVDHKLGGGRDNALHSAWFGPMASKKREAMDSALAYARVR